MLRDLWRHRLAVVGVLLLALLASTLVLYKFSPPLQLESRKYNVGVATTSVLIDTPSSQVARIAPEGSGDLGMRADLLARLMVDGVIKAEIAKAAGLDPDALFGISTAASDQPVSAAPPRGAPVLTTQGGPATTPERNCRSSRSKLRLSTPHRPPSSRTRP